MQVKDLMTSSPAYCERETPLIHVAQMMEQRDCGEIPVLDERHRPIGVITDRDMVIRAFAQRRNPFELSAGECMTAPCVCVAEETSLDECVKILERMQIRRAPVVDADGVCVGMISQADIAREASEGDTGELVRAVSMPAPSTSTWS